MIESESTRPLMAGVSVGTFAMESNHRSIAKAVSYRLLGSLTTAFIFFVLSGGDAKLSLGAGALDSILKIGLYFIHERLWNYIDFGRQKPPEYEI